MKLSKQQRLTRIIVLTLLVTITGLSFSLIVGHYFSLKPVKEFVRSDLFLESGASYTAALNRAYSEQRALLNRYLLIGLGTSSSLALILILCWNRLYQKKKIMSNLYRWLTILLSMALAAGIIYLAHYIIHRYLYDEMHWYAYLANRFRINNIIVFLALFIIPICLALGAIASYFLIGRFLYPPRNIQLLTSKSNSAPNPQPISKSATYRKTEI